MSIRSTSEFPSQREDEVTIELPSEWKVVSVPPPQKRTGAFPLSMDWMRPAIKVH